MRTTLLLLALLTLAACATYDSPPEPYPDSQERGAERVERPRRAAAPDLALPSSWWRDPGLAEPLALSSEQFQRLDALGTQQDEADRLERDAAAAARELRNALQERDATPSEIQAAGKRLRELRDTLLDRQITLLAAQREILTWSQWDALQDAIANEWRERGAESRPRMRGRGGFGGRRPGRAWR
jgi:hypothetical protein